LKEKRLKKKERKRWSGIESRSKKRFKEKQNMDLKKRHEKLILSYLNKHKHINEHKKGELYCWVKKKVLRKVDKRK
jgi:hypothetical protein